MQSRLERYATVDSLYPNCWIVYKKEKKELLAEEREEKKKDYYVQERRYGEFRRSLRLPQDADAEKISASFEKGVLSVDIPRAGAKKRGRKISVSKT